MDMEKLNKSQIVLLTLLVSFMTSIATGIVTVALMEQAPPVITETVNRVVEHTVERVVPGQMAAAAAAAPPETKTIIVHEADLIPKAVETITPSLVRVHTTDTANPAFLGLGIVLNNAGLIAVDAGALGDKADMVVELPEGLRVRGFVQARDQENGIAYIAAASSTENDAIVWTPAKLFSGKPALGASVVLISGKSAVRVAQGLVTSFTPLTAGAEATQVLETDLPKDGILSGSPIIDTQGHVLGISTSASREVDGSGFIPGALLHLPIVKEQKEKTTTSQ
jgi:S1-C subfamily serine protease